MNSTPMAQAQVEPVHELYATQFSPCTKFFDFGRAIWAPPASPYDTDFGYIPPRAQIGDVGFFDSRKGGAFVRVFNVLLSAWESAQEHWPLNAIPEGYVQLDVPGVRRPTELVWKGGKMERGVYHSEKVLISAPVIGCTEASAPKHQDLTFSFNDANGGGLLVLPQGATYEFARSSLHRALAAHLRKHHRSYTKFAQERCELDHPPQIVLITQCGIAKEWAMGAYKGEGRVLERMRVRWVPGGTGREVRFASGKGLRTVSGAAPPDKDGQCVFLGGLQVQESRFLPAKIDPMESVPPTEPKRKWFFSRPPNTFPTKSTCHYHLPPPSLSSSSNSSSNVPSFIQEAIAETLQRNAEYHAAVKEGRELPDYVGCVVDLYQGKEGWMTDADAVGSFGAAPLYAVKTNDVAPPAGEENGIALPPATKASTVDPPTTKTNTIASPPATKAKAVGPLETKANAVVPPATKANAVAPPVTKTDAVNPPVTKASDVAPPPATKENAVGPPVTKATTVAPSSTKTKASTEENTYVPDNFATDLMAATFC